jgi:hypothetical protein
VAKAAAKGRSLSIGLFTVKTDADAEFRKLVPETLKSPFPSSRGTIVRHEADGYVTYSLDVTPVGLRITVR